MFRYQRLAQKIIQAIKSQRLQVGDKLPSIRQQCLQQGLAKATVIRAYQELEQDGWLLARPKSGYFIAPQQQPAPKPRRVMLSAEPNRISPDTVLDDVMMQGAAFDILPEQGRYDQQPDTLIQLNRAMSRALRHQRGLMHQYYDETAGYRPLRELIVGRLNRHGCQLQADQLSVTSGCQQALTLALMAVTKPGDAVAVESPGYYGSLQLIERLGLKVMEVPCDVVDGMDMDALQQGLQRWPIKACIVTPSYATPTGAVLPSHARLRLIALAKEHRFTLVEDDIYGELGFHERHPPLYAQDEDHRVVLCGSFSKSLSRDMRLGWVVGGRYQTEINRLKRVINLASSRFVQQGVADYLQRGDYDRHLRWYRGQLQQQRDQLVMLVQRYFPQRTRYGIPLGGLSLWLELPEKFNTMVAYQQAREAGILMTPGALFSTQSAYDNCLRLSFAHPWTKPRADALRQLASILTASR